MKNLNTTGTFEDYIGSIHAEIARLLGTPPEGERYWVETKSKYEGPRTGWVKSITISDGTAYTTVSFAECEFEHKPQNLEALADVRLQVIVEDLKDMVEGPNRLIERLTIPEPEPKKMMLHEAREYLNIIAIEINEAVGEKILGEFLSCYAQPMVLQSHVDIVVEVNIDFKEATGHRVKEIVLARTIRTYDEMIKLLGDTKTKLEAL